MPSILDKSTANLRDIEGDDAISKGLSVAIRKAYQNVIMLAEEIKEGGWLAEPDVLNFLVRQEGLCKQYEGDYFNHHEHKRNHLKDMRTLSEDMRVYVDRMRKIKP